jgi:glycosyltransferase involved in cell wall biosynthesis
MRVTHVITRLVVGGAQENTVSSVLGLAGKPGFQVDLIAGPSTGPEGSLEESFRRSGGQLTLVPELVREISPMLDWKALRKLRGIFEETRPDIVHTHSGKAGILGRLAAHQAGVPIVIHTIHGPSFGAFQGPVSNVLFRSAEKRAERWTTHFAAVSQAMIDQYLAAGIGRPDQYTKILSGFDLNPFLNARNNPAIRQKFGIAPEDIVVGTIARLFALKGHDDLIDASVRLLKAVPRLKFLWIGDGSLRQRLEERIRKLNLTDRFVFTGLIPPGRVSEFVGVMDILAHLSRREGLPRAIPQALAAAKPVVAYDCDGAREACLDGETGFLVSAGNLAGLEEKITLLADDPDLRARLGDAGQQLVKRLFSVENMVDDLDRLYVRLGAGKSNPR